MRKSKLKSKRVVRFPGICATAAKLKVSRHHLWSVLTARRISEPLMLRYRKLKKEAA
jgi:hypothetical protein